jgi:hypothetical protein
VRIRDCGHDREAQPGAGGVARSAAEPLERARNKTVRKAGSPIDDVKLE